MVYGGKENRMKLTFRIWILIIALLLSLLAIKPSFESGVLIKSVDNNSSAFESGMRAGEIIKAVNGENIENNAPGFGKTKAY